MISDGIVILAAGRCTWRSRHDEIETAMCSALLIDNIIAGADTTAAALSIGIHWLARSPDLWQQLQDELRPVMDDAVEFSPRIEMLAQLPLLNAVLKEGLRVSCPIRGHMPRVVPAKGWNYNGTHLPAGVTFSPPQPSH